MTTHSRSFCLWFAGLFLSLCSLRAQYTVSGRVEDTAGKGLPNATVLFSIRDTLAAATVTDRKGEFRLQKLPAGVYTVRYSMLGYRSLSRQETVRSDSRLDPVRLEEDPVTLQEVTVDAERDRIVRMEAGSSSFFISEQMKKKARTLFEALQEVPLLSVDLGNRIIRMTDGTTPIILINGVRRDNVLESLDPKNIESVEVIENPSARYRSEEGNVKVLNLHMRRDIERVQSVNLFTKQMLDGQFGVYQASYGMEQERLSIFLTAQDWYTHRIRSDVDNRTSTGTFTRELSGTSRSGSNSLYVGGNGDWVISGWDYLSYGFGFVTNPSSSEEQEGGRTTEGELLSTLSLSAESKSSYVTGNYNVYYRHTFTPERHLEVTGVFGHYNSGPEGWRREESGLYAYRTYIDMDNRKQYAKVEANYDFSVADLLSVNIGSNTYYQHISLRDLEESFPYEETREYLYADLRNRRQGRFGYMLSLGLDLVFRNSGHVRTDYVTLLPSLSLSYKLHEQGSLRLNLNRSRIPPSIERLNPRVATTDSLCVTVGNPYLKPTVSNYAELFYSLNLKRMFLSPRVSYSYNQDNVIPVGELEGNVYRNSYVNGDHSQYVSLGMTVGLRLGQFGNINVTPGWQKTAYHEPMSFDGKSWNLNANVYLSYKKVYFYGNVYYVRYSYTRTTRMTHSPMVEMNFSWNLPKGWTLNLGMRDNAKSSRMWQRDGDYTAYSRSYVKDWSWTPMAGFSYNFRSKSQLKQREKRYQRGDDTDEFSIKVK
ncbi:MAG: outer membrane beta-barrel protein [Parabacteroides sp.]